MHRKWVGKYLDLIRYFFMKLFNLFYLNHQIYVEQPDKYKKLRDNYSEL